MGTRAKDSRWASGSKSCALETQLVSQGCSCVNKGHTQSMPPAPSPQPPAPSRNGWGLGADSLIEITEED